MFKVTILEDPAAKKSYDKLFPDADKIYHTIKSLPDSDLLVLTGGVDVNPTLYGDTKHESTYMSEERDSTDLTGHNLALLLDIPVVGICRGAQFLNIMNGGPLIQDVSNHGMGTHEVITKKGDKIKVRGDHHQMMVPFGDYVLEAWTVGLSGHYEFGGKLTEVAGRLIGALDNKEPEVVFWPDTKALAIQFHPEWDTDNEGSSYFNELLDKYILN